MTLADVALLDDLRTELNRGRVYECSLRDPKWHLDGFAEGDEVYIDPRPAILETVLHELLHRMKPRWRERRVYREARRLMGGMDDATKARWWAAYQRIKQPRRPKTVED